ncbi:hypothetical protein COLO4_06471 [Corchorus olitorius]|uniref:DUF4216 domain-containing protein n=1 Tax=Corchorus olitorius TaxID=93759 RepID=A0A1R3KMZ0_9ROSI|nr:hypothetical protein COLO4_06471 [Corchorus olitorius]
MQNPFGKPHDYGKGQSQGRPKSRWLSDDEFHAAHLYVLLNCPEVQEYHELFVNYLKGSNHTTEEIGLGIEMHFVKWFKLFVQKAENKITDPLLHSLALGPSRKATTWPGYFINGFNFCTVEHGVGRRTMNSGVFVRGSESDESSTGCYGLLLNIVQVEYCGDEAKKVVVLFECSWVETTDGMKVHPLYNIVDINRKELCKDEPFILAQEAIQVYYCSYPSIPRDKSDWKAVCDTKPRRVRKLNSGDGVDIYNDDDDAYQIESMLQTPAVSISKQVPQLFDPQGINLAVGLGEMLEVVAEGQSEEENNEDGSTSHDDDDQGDNDSES